MAPQPRRTRRNYSISGHARSRMAQRGIPPWVVDFMLDSGVRERVPERDCVRVLFPAEFADQPALRGYTDVELILDPVRPRVITVQRIDDRDETRKKRPDRRCSAGRAEGSRLRVFTGETGPGPLPPDRSVARAAESRDAASDGGPRGEGPSRMATPAVLGGPHEAAPLASALAEDTPAYHARSDRGLAELDATLEPIEGFLRGIWIIRWAIAVGIVLVGLVVGWALTTVW